MGVGDHNVIHAEGSSQSLYVGHPGYANGGTRGHESWADYPYFGTQNFFFFEDNTIAGNGVLTTSGASDAEFGARFVIRHNDWTNARPGWHGTEAHQWIGYSVTNMNPQAAPYLKGSVITDNTQTRISYIFYEATDRTAIGV